MPRSVLLIASTTLIAASVLVPSAGATVLGPDTGVTATRSGRDVDVTFTPGALAGSRLKAGRTVRLDCRPEPPSATLLLASESLDQGSDTGFASGDGTVAAGGVVHVKLDTDVNDGPPGVLDTCDVNRVRHIGAHATVSNTVARVPLTPAGATVVDETERATALRHLLQKAHAASGYQPVAALGSGVVAMDSPAATPPAGQTEYWTDGTRAAVATLSAAGRRLAIEDQGGLVLRTNVLEQMDPYGLDDDLPQQLPAALTTTSSTRSPDTDKRSSPYRSHTPLQAADGIRVALLSGHRATVRFTGRAARTLRALRGRRITVACQAVPAPSLFPDLLAGALAARGGGGVGRVPRRGGAVTVTLEGDRGDVCDVIDDGTEVAVAGATAAGRAWMQDLAALLVFTGADTGSGFAAPGAQSYRPTDQLVAGGRKHGFVAMSGPEGAVPVGRVGVWSDGAKQAAIAVQSASGRRLVLADEGDGVVRTNILSTLSWLSFSESLAIGTESGSSAPSSPSGSISGEFDSK